MASQTAVKPATLDRTKRMTVLYGAQKTSPPKVAEAGETRARAFTLFVKAYENARRAMTFIRWFERDADELRAEHLRRPQEPPARRGSVSGGGGHARASAPLRSPVVRCYEYARPRKEPA